VAFLIPRLLEAKYNPLLYSYKILKKMKKRFF